MPLLFALGYLLDSIDVTWLRMIRLDRCFMYGITCVQAVEFNTSMLPIP